MSLAAWGVVLLLALATAAGTGWRLGVKNTLADWNAERVLAQEQARLLAQSQAVQQRKIDDDLTEALLAGADLAHDAEQRLRLLAAKYRRDHAAAGAECRDDAPPAARLSEATRNDLVRLARDANDCAHALGAWQRRDAQMTPAKEDTP